MSRRVVVTDEAREQLSHYIDYLISEGAVQAALKVSQRFETYLTDHLAIYPHVGLFIDGTDFYEVWISGTRLVLWYQFSDEELIVLAAWHTSQDRS
jgi:plasmid stabilization system protein ParE